MGNFTSFVTATFGLRDPLLMRAAFHHLREGDHVIDVGANIGCYAIFLAPAVGKSGSVIAYEPNPATFEFLRQNIVSNRASMVAPIMKGLGRAPGKAKLVTSVANCGEAHISPEQERGDVEITLSSLDFELTLPEGERSKVRYLKIDVEGYECEVLAGAAGLLAANRKILVQIENEPRFLGRYTTEFRDAHAMLSGLGYRPFTTYDGMNYARVDGDIAGYENLVYKAF